MILLKYIGTLVFALTIDALQLFLAFAVFVVFLAAPGTAVGAGAGAALCGKVCAAAGGAIGAVLDSIPATHVAVTAVTESMGLAAAEVIDFSISVVFGTGLILWLMFTGLLRWQEFFTIRRLPFAIAKFIPLINSLPFYTGMAILCILRTEAREGSGVGVAGAALAFAVAGAGPVNRLARQSASYAPGTAFGGRQSALSAYETTPAEDAEAAGVARRIRPLVSDIRPRTALSAAHPANDNDPRNVSYGKAA